MRVLVLLMCLIMAHSNSYSQTSIKLHKIFDYDNIEFKKLSYEDFTTFEKGRIVFKEEYKYLEGLQLDTFHYESDGYNIFAYAIYPKEAERLPCIIFNRGGNRNLSLINSRYILKYLSVIASSGFCVVASTYRGNNFSEGKDEYCGDDVNDVLNLMKVITELKYIDTSRVGMYGWSRGGLMSYIAIPQLSNIKTVVIGGCPTDFFMLVNDRPEFEKQTLATLIPDYYAQKNRELYIRSPILWYDKIPQIPILIIHGKEDDRVPYKHAQDMFDKLRIKNNQAMLKIYPDEGHNILKAREDLNNTVINWFQMYL